MRAFRIQSLFALLLATSAATAYATPRTFIYRVSGLVDMGDCHAVATEMGQTFQTVTGITPETAVCTDIGATTSSYEITYKAEERLRLISTNDRTMSDGIYGDLADCRADVAAEAAYFEQATGLAPVVANCARLPYEREHPFFIRIDSFGEATMRPFHSWSLMVARPLGMDLDDLEAEIFQVLQSRDIDVRSVKIVRSIYGDTYISYYAEDRINFDFIDMAQIRTRAQCDEQLELMRNITHTRSLPPVVMFCADSGGGGYVVQALYANIPERVLSNSAERFTSYDTCMQERSTIMADYDVRNPGSVAGGLCTVELGVWRVRLINL